MVTKVTPSADYPLDIADGKVKDAVAATGATNTNMMMVAPDQLTILDGFNLRITGTPDYEAGIREIAESIKANGFYRDKPFSVKIVGFDDGSSGFAIMDGHRRYAALQIALLEAPGCVEQVPIVEVRKGTTMADALIAMMQTGVGLTAYEKSLGVSRLVKAGLDEAQIAQRLGMSKQYVGNLIVLCSMPLKIRNMVQEGKVSASAAVREFQADPRTAVARLSEGLETAKARGKEKAAPKDIKGASKPTKDTAATKAGGAKPGPKPNPLKTEFLFQKAAGDIVTFGEAGPFTGFGGGEWFMLGEKENTIVILQDVKISGRCVLKAKPDPKAAAVKDVTSDL
jgi:ParB family chromosome partitioning protein